MFALRGAAGASPLTRRRVHRGQIGGRRLPMPGGASPPMRRQVHRGRWVTDKLVWHSWAPRHLWVASSSRRAARNISRSGASASPPPGAANSSRLAQPSHGQRAPGLAAVGGEFIEAARGCRPPQIRWPRRQGRRVHRGVEWNTRPHEIRASPPTERRVHRGLKDLAAETGTTFASPPTRRRVHPGTAFRAR